MTEVVPSRHCGPLSEKIVETDEGEGTLGTADPWRRARSLRSFVLARDDKGEEGFGAAEAAPLQGAAPSKPDPFQT